MQVWTSEEHEVMADLHGRLVDRGAFLLASRLARFMVESIEVDAHMVAGLEKMGMTMDQWVHLREESKRKKEASGGTPT